MIKHALCAATGAAAVLLVAGAPAVAAAPGHHARGHHARHHYHYPRHYWSDKPNICHDKGILGFFSPLLEPDEATTCDMVQYPHLLKRRDRKLIGRAIEDLGGRDSHASHERREQPDD